MEHAVDLNSRYRRALQRGQQNTANCVTERQTEATLERLGYAPNTRMACCARVEGPVSVALKPDKANASALALLPRDSTHRLDRLWKLVRDTCPLPLLDHWRETVLELLQSHRVRVDTLIDGLAIDPPTLLNPETMIPLR